MGSSTRTRYAASGNSDIAYQVLGDGPRDLLLITGDNLPIDCMDEEPSLARMQRRLSSFGRLIRYDRRGVGLSDRGSPASLPTEQQHAQDAVAVLDAVGCDSAVVFAPNMASPYGITLAAAEPERISGLVLINGFARAAWAQDYPWGIPLEALDTVQKMIATDAVEQGNDNLAVIAPSVAHDPIFRAWYDRSGNLGATPAMARAMANARFDTDVRRLLPHIDLPTLVMGRVDSSFYDIGHSRYLAGHIPGARLVELPGADLPYWIGDTRVMLDEIEEFVTGVRGSGAERVLATVLFTDIVGSTSRAAELGDGRWRDLLDHHDHSIRVEIARFRGRVVNTVGDGFVATFDSPGRAIECALAIREALKSSDLTVRAGIHTGEIEVRGEDIAGLAVHIGARVAALAGPGEVFVSSAVPPLVAGSNVDFLDRGEHELKGVPGTWRILAVAE